MLDIHTPLCFKCIQPMYVSVYQHMNDIFHMLTYASMIRHSVTGPLLTNIGEIAILKRASCITLRDSHVTLMIIEDLSFDCI